MNFYDFEAEDVLCNTVKMEEYRGKVVLIVNTATRCGFTPQYDDLQDLYEKYQDQGFQPGHPLVTFIESVVARTHSGDINSPDIKWNFTKFLIDREGNVIERFEPTEDMSVVEQRIKELL